MIVHERGCVYNFNFHLVFVTKYRKKVFDSPEVDIVKGLKGWTARKWFELYPETKQMLWGGHLWSPSYFMSTLGDMSKEVVKNYIASQYTAAMKKQQNGKYGELERKRRKRN